MLFTCCVRLSGKSYAKIELKVQQFSRILSTAVKAFQVFTLNKFNSTHKFSLNPCQEFFSYEVVATNYHFSKPVLLTSEREFRLKFAFLSSANEVHVFPFQS